MKTTSSSTPRFTTTPSARTAGERALVLGGGGSTGNAWLIGVLAGLFEAGLDVTTADLTVGTSAGATAAAQIAGASLSELLAATLASKPPQRGGTIDSSRVPAPSRPVVNQLERIKTIIAAAADPADMRRAVGAAALKLDAASDGSWQAQWRSTVAARLPSQFWPQRKVLLTAVNAQSGEPVVFDRQSGIELVDAVAASCSSGLPYRIEDSKYLDGGYRCNAENADLAAGYRRVLVLSPFGGRTLMPLSWGMDLARHIKELRKGGSQVETIFPDSSSEHMFGSNAMDLSLRPAAAQAGHLQGSTLAEQLTEFWS